MNPDNQNIDVCCRDPNYEDLWPGGMMNGGGGGNGGGGNQGRNQFSGGNQNGGNQFSGGNQGQGQQHPVQQQANPGFGNNAVQPRNGGGGGGSRGGYGK